MCILTEGWDKLIQIDTTHEEDCWSCSQHFRHFKAETCDLNSGQLAAGRGFWWLDFLGIASFISCMVYQMHRVGSSERLTADYGLYIL